MGVLKHGQYRPQPLTQLIGLALVRFGQLQGGGQLLLQPMRLVALLLLRVLLFPQAFWRALIAHETGAGFLALVPATTLLGSQLVQLRGNHWLGSVLWAGAGGCWVLLLYTFLWGISTGAKKPTLEQGFSGRWLLLVVATEALAVLGARQLPGPVFLRELTAAVMRSTGRVTSTAMGTVDPTQGDLRRNNVFIVGTSSFRNAQKVPAW